MSLKELFSSISEQGKRFMIGVELLTALNIATHHRSYETQNASVSNRVDGVLSYTQLVENDDGSIQLNRYSPSFGTKRYMDYKGDGRVDEITIEPLFFAVYTKTSKDKQSHPEAFSRANEVYTSQLDRFSE